MSETPSARDFVEHALRDDPNLSYADVKERAASVGLNVPPFLYGSMRRQLGIAMPTPSSASAAATPTAARTTQDEGSGDVDAALAQREERDDDDDREEDRDDRDDASEEDEEEGRSEGGTGAGDADLDRDDRDDRGDRDDRDEGGEAEAPGAPKKQNAFEFAREMLQLSPDISYQDLKLRGKMAGLHVAPIVFGRAKALLGLVPMKPRKSRQRAEPPRSLQQVESAAEFVPSRSPDINGLEFVEQLVARVRQLESEREQLRSALEQALALVREALD